MRSIIRTVARALFHAGGLGLLTLGAFDSSPLVVPMGNDLLLLALSARYHERVLYYVVMATVGSLIGCFTTDWISRKSESGQKKLVSGKHLDYIRKQVGKQAGWTLAVAALMPPPFPFTAFVAAAAAFRYPRSNSWVLSAWQDLCGLRSKARLRFTTDGGSSSRLNRRCLTAR